jgi:hypothetical protein
MKQAAAIAAAAIAAIMLLPSCATRPIQAASPHPAAAATYVAAPAAAVAKFRPTVTTPSAPASALQPQAPSFSAREAGRENFPREKALPGKARVDYLDAALADYWRETLPNGATLAVKRQSGRRTAAARIVLARDAEEKAKDAGLEALALSAAAKGPAGSESGGLELAALEAGGAIELKLEDYDDVALELVCPEEKLANLLELAARALASPEFPQGDFDRALREARVAERRESGDPLLRAAAELRSGLYQGHPYGLPPRGTAKSLAGVTREDVSAPNGCRWS